MLLEPPWQGRGVTCSVLEPGHSPEMPPAAAGRAGEQKRQLTRWGRALSTSTSVPKRNSGFAEKQWPELLEI